MSVSAVGRVEQLAQTVVAGRDIERHVNVRIGGSFAAEDDELLPLGRRARFVPKALDDRARRSFAHETIDETLDRSGRALDVDQDVRAAVLNEPPQLQ
jgi:hypothetical protein